MFSQLAQSVRVCNRDVQLVMAVRACVVVFSRANCATGAYVPHGVFTLLLEQ
jgi:hypothetical protein